MHQRPRLLLAAIAAFVMAASGLLSPIVTGQAGSSDETSGANSDNHIKLRPPLPNPTTNRSYAPDPERGVLVRDASSGILIAAIPVAPRVVQVAVNPHTNLIYAISSTGMLTVIDGLTDSVVATLAAGPSGTAIGINTATSRIYVGTSAGLTVIDGYVQTVAARLPGVYADPDIAVNETTNRIYATSRQENLLRAVDGRTHAVVAALAVGDRPAGVAVDPLSNRIYVANAGTPIAGAGDTVTVIDGDPQPIGASLSVGSGGAI